MKKETSLPVWLTTGGNNPFLPELLAAFGQAHQIQLAIAFIKLSGLDLIWTALEDALSRGVRVQILTGDYLGLTDPAALRRLLQLQDFSQVTPGSPLPELRVFASQGQSFHPKAYIFVSLNPADPGELVDGLAFIGSSNLSKSALTNGIEWNLRIDQQENPARFAMLFNAFDDLFNHSQTQPLTPDWINAYQARRRPLGSLIQPATPDRESEMDVPEPSGIQIEALVQLDQARQAGARRGLVVLATGLGKTWLSAFDARQVCQTESPHLLFVAHREEILRQAEATYLRIFPEARTGWYSGTVRETEAELLFASIQTLGQSRHLERFAPDAFDYIVVDEFHHAAANTYRQLLRYFKPRFLLGLTATPERTDQADILSLCDGNLIYTADLIQGIQRQLLSPFHYFGIQDKYVDYARIGWRQGRFDEADLERQVSTERRAAHVLAEWQARKQARTLAFCVSKHHAEYMAAYFMARDVSAVAVHSTSSTRRDEALTGLVAGHWDVVFSVDLFNEGVDVPAIDTVMLLRPTESRILFLQQLGRGLRKSPEHPEKRLHVLDFLGNHKAFLNRPQALFGVSPGRESLGQFVKQIERKQLPLPPDCELTYDLEALDFFKAWSQNPQTSRVLDVYQQLKEALGTRPSAQEMYQSGGDDMMQAIRKEWGSWLALVAEQGDLSESERACFDAYTGFLQELDTTSLTKSYKMVTLQALLELDGLRQPPDVVALSLQAYDVLCRRRALRRDLEDLKALPWASDLQPRDRLSPQQEKEWVRYWRKNPIDVLCKGQQSWFELNAAQQFIFLPGVPESLTPDIYNLLQELIDYRLFKYAPSFTYQHTLKGVEQTTYTHWHGWLQAQPNLLSVPLFATETHAPLLVKTHTVGRHRLLCRHPEMEEAIVTAVEEGLNSLTWTGLLFVMGYGDTENLVPLHVSYTERMGRQHAVSQNILNIRVQRNKFARWGDNLKYNFGDLSQVLFDPRAAEKNSLKKWGPALFASSDPPLLKEPVQLLILPWHKGMTDPAGDAVLLPQLKQTLLSLITQEPNRLIT